MYDSVCGYDGGYHRISIMFDFSAGSWRSTAMAGRKMHDAANGLALQTMANNWRLLWSGPAAMHSLVFARAATGL